MTTAYLPQIDDLITYHRNEIERLETARAVIQQLQQMERTKTPAMTLNITPQAKVSAITIRKIAAPEVKEKEVKRRSREGLKQGRAMRNAVLVALKDGALTTQQIRDKLYLTDEEHAKPLWNSLYYMSKELKTIVRREDGLYELPKDVDVDNL